MPIYRDFMTNHIAFKNLIILEFKPIREVCLSPIKEQALNLSQYGKFVCDQSERKFRIQAN